jgi:hypothetical protein
MFPNLAAFSEGITLPWVAEMLSIRINSTRPMLEEGIV